MIPIILGLLAGAGYGIVDWYILDRLPQDAPKFFFALDELFDLFLPVLLGATMGWCVYLMRQQRRTNARLSLENSRLQHHVWANTLIAQVLHDIRNPIHNLSAALEDCLPAMPDADRVAVQRNLEKLEHTTAQYSRWAAIFDTLDPSEPCAIKPAVEEFLRQKALPRLAGLNVAVTVRLTPADVYLHPLLLESILVSVFSNVCEALARQKEPRRLHITVSMDTPHRVRVLIANTGAFPPDALKAQGHSPIVSAQGLGVGLMLVKKMLEVAGGELSLANEDRMAVLTMILPGASR